MEARRPAGRLQQFRQEVLAGSEQLLWRRWWGVIKFRIALDYFALERGCSFFMLCFGNTGRPSRRQGTLLF